jgi:hypothetical protein
MKSKEGIVFIAIVAVLSIALFAGGFWVINTQKQRDKRDLQTMLEELSRLETRAATESGYAKDGIAGMPNADSVASELERVGEQIRKDKTQITNAPDAVLAKYKDFQDRKATYGNAIESAEAVRNQYASTYISSIKDQVAKYKTDLDAAIKRNKSLSAQLGGSMKNLKLAKADLDKMKAKLIALEKSGIEMQALRGQLEQSNAEKANLTSLLEQSKKMLQEQEARIQELLPLNQRILNFKAQYQLRSSGKFIELGSSPENLPRQVDDLNISFECGAALFDNDDKDKIVYMTIFDKTNKPYRTYNRVALRMQLDAKTNLYKAKQRYEINKKMDEGNYTIRLFYKEKQVLEDYKFTLN